MADAPALGGCACGNIRIAAQGAPLRVGLCHCLDCRKHHGAVFYAAAIFPKDAVTVTGTPQTYKGRAFCGTCGGSVFAITEGEVEVHLGTLDHPNQFTPTYEGYETRREHWLSPLDNRKDTATMHTLPLQAFIVSVMVIRGSGPDTEVLMMRRKNPPAGTWAQVAGKIEAGETAWQAALREVGEETGLSPDALFASDAFEQFYEPDRDAITIAPVFVARVGRDAQVTLNAEHDDFRWLSLEDAIALVDFGGQRRILKDVKDEFVTHTPSEHLRISF